MQQRLAAEQIVDHDAQGVELVNAARQDVKRHGRRAGNKLRAIAAGQVAIVRHHQLGVKRPAIDDAFDALHDKPGSGHIFSSTVMDPTSIV